MAYAKQTVTKRTYFKKTKANGSSKRKKYASKPKGSKRA